MLHFLYLKFLDDEPLFLYEPVLKGVVLHVGFVVSWAGE